MYKRDAAVNWKVTTSSTNISIQHWPTRKTIKQ